MTVSYTQVTVSGYNSTPPSDDGTVTASNQVLWSTIKTKLSDPLKTALETIDDNVAAAIALAEADINTLEAADTTIRGELNAPATTAMLFQQTAAPTGWTKVTTHNDKALRLVSGTVSSGGSTAFTSVFTSRTIATANLPSHTHSFSATTSSDGAHTHNYDKPNSDDATSGGKSLADDSFSSTATSSSGAHTHTVSGTTGATGSGTAMDFAVQYVDVIIATKD